MRRIHKLFAVGASGLLFALTLTPAALAAGTLKGSSATSAKSAAGVKYSGKTSQHKTFKMAVTNPKNGTITSGVIYWKQRCTGKFKSLRGGTDFHGGRIKSGTLEGTASYEGTVTSSGKSYTGQFTFTIVSHTASTKANGTWKISAKVYSGAKQVSACHSGKITWHANKS